MSYSHAGAIARIALQNKAVVYDILFRAAAETVQPSPPTPSISGPPSA
jgi:hypothetical protein